MANSKRGLRRGDGAELAGKLIRYLSHGKPNRLVYSEGKFWKYNNGYWRKLSESYLHRVLQKFAGERVGRTRRLHITDAKARDVMRCLAAKLDKPEFFAKPQGVVVFKNKTAMPTKEGKVRLVPHSSEFRARHAYPFNFPIREHGGLHIKILEDMFGQDSDGKEKVELIRELFGVALIGRGTEYQRVLVLKGVGGDGKGSITRLLSSAFPKGAVSAVSPGSLTGFNPEYYLSLFPGCLLNVVNDPEWDEVVKAGNWKSLVSGDEMVFRRLTKDPVVFRPIAGHVITTNALPASRDQSVGFWRRFALVMCNRSFTEEGTEKIGLVGDKEIAEAMPDVVLWLLTGAANLLRRGKLKLPSSHGVALAEWQLLSDPLRVFLQDATTPSTTNYKGTRAQDAYGLYTTWCYNNGHKPMSSTAFGKRMGDLKMRHRTEKGMIYLFLPRSAAVGSESRMQTKSTAN